MRGKLCSLSGVTANFVRSGVRFYQRSSCMIQGSPDWGLIAQSGKHLSQNHRVELWPERLGRVGTLLT